MRTGSQIFTNKSARYGFLPILVLLAMFSGAAFAARFDCQSLPDAQPKISFSYYPNGGDDTGPVEYGNAAMIIDRGQIMDALRYPLVELKYVGDRDNGRFSVGYPDGTINIVYIEGNDAQFGQVRHLDGNIVISQKVQCYFASTFDSLIH